MPEGASMEGLPRERDIIRKPQIKVEVGGKFYSVYEQGTEGVYSILTEDGRSFVNEPGESAEEFIKRALKMGLKLREAR
jgi:hypothetical protein